MLSNYTIKPINKSLLESVQSAIDIKTKPPGSLGRIEDLALQMAGAQNSENPVCDPARLFIFAGDHGLTAEGVSAWPSEVTTQMVANFLKGGAAANVFARTNNVDITIVDAGIIGDLPDHQNLIKANIRKGTRNAMHEDALTADELEAALQFGAKVTSNAAQKGDKVILFGEMGIGNTSSATLLAHSIIGTDLETLTGPGAGLDEDGVNKKVEILKRVAARKSGKLEPTQALQAFGGLEIAMITGGIIGAAANKSVALIDGFIASSAALCAIKARPELAPYVVFSHRSEEPGHRAMTQAVDAVPLMDLNLRLGEGTGALLALPLLRNACAMLADMATFESAGVSDKEA
ncbi:MAG: nicotinate-nucleotide--dimethylbenzimidazole phosphoribosyltransferase [Rhizobiales bacterium]|nr:nicotinate-nucleotide--dimethylbenzimidazole phosphoribosyltransferase [Hyphomicrobiales bacterium]